MLRFDRSQLRFGTSARCTIGVAVPLLAAVTAGKPALGVLAALGALYAGLSSFNGVYRHRFRLMAATSFVTASVTLIGSMLSPHPDLAVPVIGIVAFAFALFAASGLAANTVAVQGTAVLVVISGIRSTAAMPLGNAGLVLAGGLFQTFLLTVVWPVIGTHPEHDAVADAYARLAEFVRDVVRGSAPEVPDRASIQHAWDLMSQLPNATTVRPRSGLTRAALQRALRGAEAIRSGLVGFARAHAREAPASRVEQGAFELATRLESVADSIRRNARPDTIAASPFVAPAAEFPLSSSEWISILGRMLDEATAGDISKPPSRAPAIDDLAAGEVPPPESDHPGVSLFNLIGSVELRSLSTKHALRYGAAVAAAVALSHVWGVGHAYWLPLTVCLTLRADYGSTLERGLGRVVGTLAGVGLAEALLSILHPTAAFLVGTMILAAGAACVVYLANYLCFAAAITVYVISSVAAASPHAPHAGMERFAATAAGAALAVLTNFLVPIWQSKQVGAVLRDALRAQIAYGDAILAAPDDGHNADTQRARHAARAMRIEAERVVAGAALEPSWSRSTLPRSPAEILANLAENASVLLALHAESFADRPEPARLSPAAVTQAQAALARSRALLDTLE